MVKKILDYLGIYEFERKRPLPKIETTPDEFDEYIRDDYIDCDHMCISYRKSKEIYCLCPGF